jgi:regulator of sirC expression with transglutaminase-like and TPR domain
MARLDPRDSFAHYLATPDASLDLLRGALVLALDEEPELDVEAQLGAFEGLARRALASLPPLAPEAARLARLNTLVFDELGLDGRGCDFELPESSFVHRVLQRRTGLPIALGVVWVGLGRRIGLRCAGVNFPGHFLAKVTVDGADRILDPSQRGRVLGPAELESRAAPPGAAPRPVPPELLAAAPAREILARMLRNLKLLYLRRRDLPRAFSAVDRLLLAQPDSAEDLRDRGILCGALGGHAAARRDLERYLALRPDAPDASELRGRLRELGDGAPLLN